MALQISDTTPRSQYTATSGQTSFSVPFEFFAAADLKVYNGTSLLTYSTSPSSASQYSVTGAGVTGGGSITLGSPGATLNDTITIVRDLAIERISDFPVSGNFPIQTLNTELDKIVAMLQQLEEQFGRTLQYPVTTTTGFNVDLPELVANRVLSVNADATALLANQELGTFKGNWAASTSYQDTSNGNIYFVNAAHTSSGTQPLSSNANSSKYDLIIDAASATTSATNAASSASAAASSASAASTSASNAATSESNASTYASNASTAQTAAEAARDAALAAADNFDDTYLGAKASDPTLDNDGDALSAGDLYFNTTSNVLKYYTGSAWVTFAAEQFTELSLDTTPQLGGNLDTNGNDINFGDNNKAVFGAGSDLQIYHDGTDSYVKDNGTGDLYLQGTANVRLTNTSGSKMFLGQDGGEAQLYYAGVEKLATKSTGVDVTGTITFDGGTTSADLNFGDNDKANFGASNDLQIYHDGSNSYISEQGTGNLIIKGTQFQVTNAGATESYISSADGGATTIYYGGNSKLATTSTGIDVTGQVLADKAYIAEATLTDGATINWDMSTQSVAKVTLGGNRTLAAPTNGSTGQFASLLVIQDGTGSRTLTWNAVYEFASDTAPTLTTTGGQGDLFVFRYNGTKWLEVGRNLNLTLS